MAEDRVRVRTVADVVVVFLEPHVELPDSGFERWYEMLGSPQVSKSLVCSTGPIVTNSGRRRRAVDVLIEHHIRIVALTEDPANLRLVAVFGFFGVPITAYAWAQLEDAARDLAEREELVGPIVRAAMELRAESPSWSPGEESVS